MGVASAEGDIAWQPTEKGYPAAHDQHQSEQDDETPNQDEELTEVGQG